MSQIKLSENFIKDRVKLALTEDLYPSGDITSNLLKNNKIVTAKLISNQRAIIAGLLFVKQTFIQVDNKIKFIIKKGWIFSKKEFFGSTIKGRANSILIAERVALNFLSHISGIATKTNQFVKIAGKNVKFVALEKLFQIIELYKNMRLN